MRKVESVRKVQSIRRQDRIGRRRRVKKKKEIHKKKTIKGKKAGAVRTLYMGEEAHLQPLTAPDCSLLLGLIVRVSISPSGFNSNLLRYQRRRFICRGSQRRYFNTRLARETEEN